MKKENIRLSWEFGHVEPSALKSLYDAVGFTFATSVNNEDVPKMFGPGAFCLFAFSDDILVGAARVFSDGHLVTWLAEICVSPRWRGRGVGHALLDEINSRFRQTALYCSALVENIDFLEIGGIRKKMKLNACLRIPTSNKPDIKDLSNVIIHDDPSKFGTQDFDNLLDSIGFGILETNIPRSEIYQRIFGEGIFCLFAESNEGELAGFVRAFSDDLTKCYVTEICVHPSWQRQAIGSALLERTASRYSHTAIQAEVFPNAIPLFESCGIALANGLAGCSRAPIKS